MPPSKNRQWVSSRARAAAIEAARRRQMRRRLIGALGAGVLVIAIIAAVALNAGGGSSKKTSATVSTTTPTSAAVTTSTGPLESAAGKPCVAVAEPAPPPSPDVPVPIGPPPSTLVKQDLKEGTGSPVAAGQTVEVNYTGVSCSTGKIFDSSYKRGQTASFALTGVIKGWQDGIPGMKAGGVRLLGIPPDEAYGSNPPPGSGIAPDETLWFVVELVSVK